MSGDSNLHALRDTDRVPASPPKTDQSWDQAKWNQVLFENANKNHLHQDNLRWTLLAGFGLFFITGTATIHDPKFAAAHALMHFIQIVLCVVGTIWFFVLLIEGWYYNLYIAYLGDCENRIARRQDLRTIAEYNKEKRPGMKSIHPSYNAALFFVLLCNSTHLFEFMQEEKGIFIASAASGAYVLILFLVSVFLAIPERLDALQNRDA